jgi:hypothetical protein
LVGVFNQVHTVTKKLSVSLCIFVPLHATLRQGYRKVISRALQRFSRASALSITWSMTMNSARGALSEGLYHVQSVRRE